jgi:hypothetical protein
MIKTNVILMNYPQVWPEVGIQLCQWHVDRAVKRKLASQKQNQRSKYQVDEAVTEFDFIDPTFIPKEHLEVKFVMCPPTLRDTVIDLLRKHFNMHPKIPVSASGEFWTCAEIRRNAVREMYDFCIAHGLASLWAYLWSSWYKATRWTLWARSTHTNIPLAKTNMVIEAHWKVLKHSYLYRFNRPRLDYLVWVICSRVLPDQLSRFQQMQLGRQAPAWFSDFKSDWKQLVKKSIADGVKECHYTDLVRWICSCPSFLGSRFLICKHLVHRALEAAKSRDSQGIRLVYANFKRQDNYPFLIWDGSKQHNSPQKTDEETSRNDVFDSRFLVADGDDETHDPDIRQNCELKVAALKRMADHLEQELSVNNLQHVSGVVNNMDRLFTMLDDIESARRKRRRDRTWRGSTPWTMFLQ